MRWLRRRRMAVTLAQLAQQAQTLSPQERSRLVEVLLESLRDTEVAEIEADWEREIADRVAAYERGEIETFATEEVFAEARRLAR
jgi:putative addiction module component (TIGR02574 family)